MKERLLEMLAGVIDPTVEISDDTDLTLDLGLKSIDLLQLITDVEDEFGIEISDEDVESIKTFGDLMNYIESLTG